jgi:hypothetical protein
MPTLTTAPPKETSGKARGGHPLPGLNPDLLPVVVPFRGAEKEKPPAQKVLDPNLRHAPLGVEGKLFV